MGNAYQEKLCEGVYNLLVSNKRYADVYFDTLLPGGSVKYLCVDVHNGDWKHDHLFIKHLIQESFQNLTYITSIEEESEDDCYSARHFYLLPEEE